jgi:hypothetical protein
VKRVDLIKAIEGLGCVLIRRGAKHDWYRNPNTGVSHRRSGNGCLTEVGWALPTVFFRE